MIDKFDERMEIGERDILQHDDGMLAWRALRRRRKAKRELRLCQAFFTSSPAEVVNVTINVKFFDKFITSDSRMHVNCNQRERKGEVA